MDLDTVERERVLRKTSLYPKYCNRGLFVISCIILLDAARRAMAAAQLPPCVEK